MYDVIHQNVADAVALMTRGFALDNASPELQEDAIKGLQVTSSNQFFLTTVLR